MTGKEALHHEWDDVMFNNNLNNYLEFSMSRYSPFSLSLIENDGELSKTTFTHCDLSGRFRILVNVI